MRQFLRRRRRSLAAIAILLALGVCWWRPWHTPTPEELFGPAFPQVVIESPREVHDEVERLLARHRALRDR